MAATNNSDVSVIVPVYNRQSTVLESLDTIVAQSYQPRCLVVVDDGSQDDTLRSLRAWVDNTTASFPIEVVHQSNRGVSAARNRAMDHLDDVPYVAFLDSDDLWPADFLSRAVKCLQENAGAVAATCDRRIVTVDADSAQATERLVSSAGITRGAARWLFANDAGIASATVFDFATLRELGCFREDLRTAEDLDLFLRVSLHGPWLHNPGLAVTFRHRLAAARGEAGNLSFHYADKFRRNAQVYDDFVELHGGRHALARRDYVPRLAGWWYRAGRELMRNGRVAEAQACFRRSIYWKLPNKAWWRLAQSYLRRAA